MAQVIKINNSQLLAKLSSLSSLPTLTWVGNKFEINARDFKKNPKTLATILSTYGIGLDYEFNESLIKHDRFSFIRNSRGELYMKADEKAKIIDHHILGKTNVQNRKRSIIDLLDPE